jgi:hypothetical protein
MSKYPSPISVFLRPGYPATLTNSEEGFEYPKAIATG